MSDCIDAIPHLDIEGLECFQEKLKHSRCYLEYGCGGSTVYACKVAKIKTVISVDSDPLWIEKVRTTLDDTTSTLFLEHCDIGEVGKWGTPKNNDKVDEFWRYMAAPWEIARQHNQVPDTVLIDGRFRVASFLYSLAAAKAGTTILFEDYLNRPHYFVAEEFCKLEDQHGRMGAFRVSHNYSIPELSKRIAQYSINWK